ncbi:metallophosphoesterase [Microbacterium sp. gxy059]|uniref:metallophosphoesterase n=1 Tax=Microbacterium sp. gxy059 TaxID=2957199 RepID=UPI003D98B59D
MPHASVARRRSTRPVALATSAVVLASCLSLSSVSALAAADDPPAVFVSEVVADNVGDDHFEYFEVTNTSDAPVSLADEGIGFSYAYSDDTAGSSVDLAVEEDVTIEAGESVVFWLSYASEKVDSFAHTVDDFREHTGADADARVVRVTGQSGMANGGERAIRVVDESGVLTWSFFPGGSMGAGSGVDFQAPGGSGAPSAVLRAQTPYTPGVVADDQLVPGDVPVPEDPDDIGELAPDPDLEAAPLQITELLPDSTNVGGSDGYEFIEVFNASSEPVDFGDYALTYLYPQDENVNTNEALWPAEPSDVVIPSGETLVLWVKNGPNDELGDADFNAHFGSDLTLGEDLVEISSAGMANGSARGIAIRTNTGFPVNRAYYNMAGASDVQPDQGIRYTGTDDAGLQRIADVRPASPGRVQVDQVADGLVVPPADEAAPVVDDRTVSEIDPSADFELDLGVTDDVQVRTVTVELRNDIDEDPQILNLVHAGDDAYRHAVAAADLTGKTWYEYTVTASDGRNETTTEARRVPVAGADTAPVRLNVADGDLVGGTHTVSAASDAYPSPLDLAIDGESVETRASLEREPVFAFEVSQTDFYFRNGVRIGEDILHIFDEGTYERTETISVPVSLSYVEQGEPLTVSVWAGTKAGPWIDEDENNDDFVMSGMRLVLPDGRTLRPAGYDDPTRIIQMGDSPGKHDFWDAEFALPDDAYTAVANDWDTTAVGDGSHAVSATDGAESAAADVVVDNTAPEIVPSIEAGRVYQGEIVLDAEVADAHETDVVALFDGERVELGHTTSSAELEAGEHVFTVSATDPVGNTSEVSVPFAVPEEDPGSDGFAPDDGSEVEAGDVILQARVDDPTDDVVDASFRVGHRADLGDEAIRAASGATRDAQALERAEPVATSDLDVTDGLEPIASDDALPYQVFDVDVPADAGDEATARLSWSGTADADAQVILYALTADGSSWTEVARHLTADDDEEFSLEGSVPLSEHASGDRIRVLVQHSEGFAGEDLSTRETAVEPRHPDDTPRSEYDFTIAWESDTQYYNEEFYEHQVAIHDYVLDQREAQNIQYLIHTGDIVDDWDQQYQWDNATAEYQRLDDAALPYGVLAGNHDVAHGSSDYAEFSRHFGAWRYEDNPWYGESFEDNRGHYDLFSAGGVDFIALYMGWDPQQQAIDWMNEVLAAHPERVAIINLHEFMLTTGGLGPVPQQIMDEVVATNPNVRLVFSGHYHDAFTRVDEFDDDGDGAPDRTVHSMLFDYQGLPEGGQGYLRLLQFDNRDAQMRVRTFSPSLERYNSDEPSLLGPEEDPYMYQDFVVSYDALGIAPSDKRLATSAFRAEVLTTDEIGVDERLASGSVATATWTLDEPGEYGWYVRTTDDHGGASSSAVQRFSLVEVTEEPEPVTPSLVVGADSVRAGETVRVSVEDFPPSSEVMFSLDADGAERQALFAATSYDGSPVGSLTTDAAGRATGGLTIPADAEPGEYTLWAVSGDVEASAPLAVLDSSSGGGGGSEDGDDAGESGAEDGSSEDGAESGADDTGPDGAESGVEDGGSGSDGAESGADADAADGGSDEAAPADDAGSDHAEPGAEDDAASNGSEAGGSGSGADDGGGSADAGAEAGESDGSGLSPTGGAAPLALLGLGGMLLLAAGALLALHRRRAAS